MENLKKLLNECFSLKMITPNSSYSLLTDSINLTYFVCTVKVLSHYGSLVLKY